MLPLLVRASLEGAVLAACVWLACRALPRLSPGVRALLWWCVAAKFVVSLVWLSPVAVPVLPRAGTDAPGVEAGVTAAPPLSAEPAVDDARPVSLPARDPGAPQIPWTAIVVGAWALGLGLSLLRTAQSWRRTRAVVARSLPGDEGVHATVRELSGRLALRRTADVRVSAEVGTPLVIGGRRPVILVPAGTFAALPADQQRMALCHELAHLKRGDVWLGCVPAAAERCFFFHPLARLAAREYAFWREAACDEAVLRALGASPQGYGRMLLALGVSRQTATFSAAGAAWSFQNLKRRLTMLDRTSSPSLRGRVLTAGVVAFAVLAIVPIRAVARSASPAAPSPSRTAGPVAALPRAVATGAESPAARVDAPAAVTAGIAKPDERRSQEQLHFVLFHNDQNTTVNGGTRDVQRARRHHRPGEQLLWFRYGGQEYVVRDAGVLRQVDELWEPMGRIGAEQGRIGAQQGEIGEAQGRIGRQQGEIGARQGEIGARQAVVASRFARLAAREAGGVSESERREIEREREQLEVQSREMGREMEALGRQMREASEPMSDRGEEMAALGREMAALGGQMQEAAERANAGMLTLVRQAIQNGTAVSVE